MSGRVLDARARPRIGLLVGAESDDAVAVAVAARTLTLTLLDRLPMARVQYLASGTTTVAAHLDCGRRARPIEDLDAHGVRRLHAELDMVISCGGSPSSTLAHAKGLGPALLTLEATALDVAGLAIASQPAELRRNRLDLQRRLGWLPGEEAAAYIVADADDELIAALRGAASTHPGSAAIVVLALTGEAPSPHPAEIEAGLWCLPRAAGVDELVAAVASATAYCGRHPLIGAIASGAGVPVGRDMGALEFGQSGPVPSFGLPQADIERALDEASVEALGVWTKAGRPDAAPDSTLSRRRGVTRTLLQCEVLRLEKEARVLGGRVASLDEELRAVVASRSWRYTAALRRAYHALRPGPQR